MTFNIDQEKVAVNKVRLFASDLPIERDKKKTDGNEVFSLF